MADNDFDRASPEGVDGSDELAELRGLGRRVGDARDTTWVMPPAAVWDSIAAAIAADHNSADDELAAKRSQPSPRRRSRSVGWMLGAAAAAAAIVVGINVLRRDDRRSEVVAEVDLERLAGGGSGHAELIRTNDKLALHLDVQGITVGDAADDGYVEVWLIDPTVSRLVSLGPLQADGVYDIPAGLDPTSFPIVDVSAEPLDGDPTHSGDSLLRGTLPL